MKYQILHGDNRETLKTIADNSIDAIVTDPPYGIDFLGKDWDANTGALETYQECLRVLKPGGHILAFSAARTYHHLAVTLEQAGFEIRDQIMWIYSSGFPKSQDVGRQLHKKTIGKPDKQRFSKDQMEPHYSPGGGSNGFGRLAFSEAEPAKNAQTTLWRHKENGKIYKALPDINGDRLAVSHEGQAYGTVYEEVIKVDNEWSGWGTQLKPAHEPIALARKPMKGSIKDNCLKWGTGALNIDATRVPYESEDDYDTYINNLKGPMERSTAEDGDGLGMFEGKTGFKAQKGKVVKSTKPKIGTMGKAPPNLMAIGTPSAIETSDQPWIPSDAGRFPSNVLGEIPDYQKYFYCPKVSRKERHIGFEQLPDAEPLNSPDQVRNHPLWEPSIGTNAHRLKQKIIAASKIKMNWEIVREMGGYYIEPDGTPILKDGDFGNQIVLPEHGHITINGIKSIYEDWCKANGKTDNHGNNHPTVKPIELMKYLIKLITPPGGTVLDPFNGSGSTGCAAVELGMTYIGCELDEKYVAIAGRRIEAWYEHCNPNTFNQLFERAA